MGNVDPFAADPSEALRRAMGSLRDGHFDGRHESGAKVNALESIAWSLIGLLGRELAADRESESLSEAFQNSGMIMASKLR